MAKLLERNAGRLAALGHPVRLAILRAVVKGPEDGTPAGDLQAKVRIPASTLSHHLATLNETGLVKVERSGNFLLYRCDFKALRALCDYVWEDCCSGGQTEGRALPACEVGGSGGDVASRASRRSHPDSNQVCCAPRKA